jgi:UPF0755 protein
VSGLNKKLFASLIIVVLLVLSASAFVVFYKGTAEGNRPASQHIEIPRGSSFTQITDTLVRHGLVSQPLFFRLYGRFLAKDKKIKAGYFNIPGGLSISELMNNLLKAKQSAIRITLIEGWSDAQVIAKIANKLRLRETIFDSLSADKDFLKSLGLDLTGITGYLLPDTYSFTYDMTEKEILAHLVRQTMAIFETDSIQQAMTALKFDRRQILTLASLIEGEALADSERVLISSVFHNRLRIGMRLQSCSTIQYILPGSARRLLLKDLEIPSEYNTYLHVGLPPGPINNPGRKSILASLFPKKSNFLYFVARGDGSHRFSASASEHNQAKADFDEIRRKYYRH